MKYFFRVQLDFEGSQLKPLGMFGGISAFEFGPQFHALQFDVGYQGGVYTNSYIQIY